MDEVDLDVEGVTAVVVVVGLVVVVNVMRKRIGMLYIHQSEHREC